MRSWSVDMGCIDICLVKMVIYLKKESVAGKKTPLGVEGTVDYCRQLFIFKAFCKMARTEFHCTGNIFFQRFSPMPAKK